MNVLIYTTNKYEDSYVQIDISYYFKYDKY